MIKVGDFVVAAAAQNGELSMVVEWLCWMIFFWVMVTVIKNWLYNRWMVIARYFINGIGY